MKAKQPSVSRAELHPSLRQAAGAPAATRDAPRVQPEAPDKDGDSVRVSQGSQSESVGLRVGVRSEVSGHTLHPVLYYVRDVELVRLDP